MLNGTRVSAMFKLSRSLYEGGICCGWGVLKIEDAASLGLYEGAARLPKHHTCTRSRFVKPVSLAT